MANQKIGGNSRKKGRMKAWCERYSNRQQAERNRAPKLAAHIRRCPWDMRARIAFKALPDGATRGIELAPLTMSPAMERAALGTTLTKVKRGFATFVTAAA